VPRYIGRAVKNILSSFYGDRFNTQSLLKKVSLKAHRYASKNFTEFRVFSGALHVSLLRNDDFLNDTTRNTPVYTFAHNILLLSD
jgi:hypothetical protein